MEKCNNINCSYMEFLVNLPFKEIKFKIKDQYLMCNKCNKVITNETLLLYAEKETNKK